MTQRYSETLRMEAALCIWEAMTSTRWNSPKKGNEPVPAWRTDLETMWDRYGTPTMRDEAISLADKALETFDLIGGNEGAEALDLVPYDWEFIPAFVARVDWKNGGLADPADIARRLKEERKCSKTS